MYIKSYIFRLDCLDGQYQNDCQSNQRMQGLLFTETMHEFICKSARYASS